MPTDCLANEIAALRPALARAARARLRNPDWAEDAVSETVLAALEAAPAFDDPARLRPWLFGVLRHKIVDQLRTHAGEHSMLGVGDLLDLERAHPQEAGPAGDPPRRAMDAQFVGALERLLGQLPAPHARAFVLRECIGAETAEICSELGISAGNLWVMLHRARTRLREGLWAFTA